MLTTPALAADWTTVTERRLVDPDKEPQNWLTYYRSYAGWRFSPLTQISLQTVKRLTPKWMLSLGEAGNQQATPLVNNGIMVVTSPFGTEANRVYAVEAASGRVLWKHETRLPEDLSGLVKIVSMNRGAALYGDRVYFGTLDARVVALSATTGSVVWQTTLADYKDGYFFTMAPLAAGGKIIVGSSGPGAMGRRGFIAALDAESGRELWRTYTIPGPGEPGNDTWAGESWKHGGGSVWLTGTYDPTTKTVFFGVGNPAPWDANLRPGKNLYTNSALALDVESGAIKWARQYHGNDTWDLDTANEHLLFSISRRGRQIPVTFQPNKTGFYFTLDRATGKVIAAKKFAKNVNIWSGVNPVTGELIENPGVRPVAGAPPLNICPSVFGGRNWAHASFNPKTNLVFLPGIEMCMEYSIAKEIEYRRGAFYTGADFTTYSPEENAGVLRAIDPINQKTVWEWWTRAPLQAGGTVATAGGLVFVGTLDGKLIALNQANGKVVWEFNLGAPVTGPPISFGLGGKQYIAAITGGRKVGIDELVGDDPKLQYLWSIPVGGTLTVFGLFE